MSEVLPVDFLWKSRAALVDVMGIGVIDWSERGIEIVSLVCHHHDGKLIVP